MEEDFYELQDYEIEALMYFQEILKQEDNSLSDEEINLITKILELVENGKNTEAMILIENLASEATSAQVLEVLSNVEDINTRKNIASNTNTPNYILEDWAEDKNINYSIKAEIASHADENILKTLVKDVHIDVVDKMVDNPNMNTDIYKELINQNYYIDEIILTSANTPLEILKIRLNQETDIEYKDKLQELLDKNPMLKELEKQIEEETDFNKLLQYADFDYDTIQSALARNNIIERLVENIDNETNPSNIEEYATLPFYHTKNHIAMNINTPSHILEDWANDVNSSVELKCWIARNPNTPDYILKGWANDKNIDEQIKINIAKNPNITLDIAKDLINNAEDSNYMTIINNLINNSNLSHDIYDYMIENCPSYVIEEIVDSHNTPMDILLKIAETEGEYIANRFDNNPKVQELYECILQETDAKNLEGYAKLPFPLTQVAIVLNPNSDANALKYVMENIKEGIITQGMFSNEFVIKDSIAQHRNISEELALTLAKDNSYKYHEAVQQKLIVNPSVSLTTSLIATDNLPTEYQEVYREKIEERFGKKSFLKKDNKDNKIQFEQ